VCPSSGSAWPLDTKTDEHAFQNCTRVLRCILSILNPRQRAYHRSTSSGSLACHHFPSTPADKQHLLPERRAWPPPIRVTSQLQERRNTRLHFHPAQDSHPAALSELPVPWSRPRAAPHPSSVPFRRPFTYSVHRLDTSGPTLQQRSVTEHPHDASAPEASSPSCVGSEQPDDQPRAHEQLERSTCAQNKVKPGLAVVRRKKRG